MLSFPDFDKKKIIVVNNLEGHKFSLKNENILVKNDKDELVLQESCYRIFSIWIIGNCTITSAIFNKSKKFGFSIHLLSINLRVIGIWGAQTEGNFLLRYKQYNYHNKEISKHLVKNKISNQLNLIKEIRNKTFSEKSSIASLEEYLLKLNSANNWKEILGTEGIASKVFFNCYFKEMNWQGRKPRAKTNELNVLLDIGYTFLFQWIENFLLLYGFDIYKGVYHQNFYQRKSLVCDIVEPFRCIIDKQLRKAYNLGQIKNEDFVIVKNQYQLKFDKNKEYTKWLMACILPYKDYIYYYCRDYYRAFMKDKAIVEYPIFEI
jgi:CRISPR-associated protein Cas1